MEKQYSVNFLDSLVESLQKLSKNHLMFSNFVEVSGYICVETDNRKKERYVLSELLQSSGNVVSESFCTKSFRTSTNGNREYDLETRHITSSNYSGTVSESTVKENTEQKTVARSRSWIESSTPLEPVHSAKRRRSSNVIVISDEPEPCMDGHSSYAQRNKSGQGLSWKKINDQEIDTCDKYRCFDASFVPEETNSESSCNKYGQYNVQGPVQASVVNGNSALDAGFAERGRSPQIQQMSQNGSDSTSHNYRAQFTPQIHQESSQFYEALDDKLTVKSESLTTSIDVVDDDDEVIDLDMFDDDFDDCPVNTQTVATTSNASEESSARRKSTVSPGSVQVVKYAVKQLQRFNLNKYGEDIDLFSLSYEQLDVVLLDFFQGVRKVSGGELSSRSLKNIQTHLDMYLRDGGYPYSIAKDDEFQSSRDFIKSKLCEDAGKTVKAQKHIPIDDQDIETMFHSEQFGDHSPEAILNTMWLLNSKYFAVRRPVDHFNMKWGEISLKTNTEGQEYLEKVISDSFSLKVFGRPDQPSRCFVNIYKNFFFSRPQEAMTKESSFYLIGNKNSDSHVRFLNEPLQWHRLTGMWRKLVVATGLPVNKKIF